MKTEETNAKVADRWEDGKNLNEGVRGGQVLLTILE